MNSQPRDGLHTNVGTNWISLNDVTELNDNELAIHQVAGRIMARAWFWATSLPEHEYHIWPPRIRQRPLMVPGDSSRHPWPTSRATIQGQTTTPPRGGERHGRQTATNWRRSPLPITSSESDTNSEG